MIGGQQGFSVRGRLSIVVALLAVLSVTPFLVSMYTVKLLTEVLIFGLLAASLDLLLGYMGLASLGHAMLFGASAYTVGMLAVNAHCSNVFIAIIPALLVSTFLALIVGFFSLRTSGIYFLMITLAFGQMFFALVHQLTEFTGGSDGCPLGRRPVLDLLAPYLTIDFGDYRHYYFVVLLIVSLCLYALRTVVNLPIGRVAAGIKENELRVKFLGFNTFTYKLGIFVISGFFAGVSGILYMYFNAFISPEDLNWSMSAKLVVMVVLGGAGTIFGPVLGACALLLMENWISSYTERWLLILGIIFVFFVLFAPGGIVGIVSSLGARWRRR